MPKTTKEAEAKLPAKLRNALQMVAAFHAMSEVFDSGEKRDAGQIQDHIWNRCVGPHEGQGNSDSISLFHMMANGLKPFDVLFEPNPNGDGTQVLKPLICRKFGLTLGKHVTKTNIERKSNTSPEIVQARTLRVSRYKDCAADLRKAMSCIYNHITPEGTIKRSGWNEEDAVNAHLDDMFQMLHNQPIIDVDSDDEDDAEDDAAEMPAIPEPVITDMSPKVLFVAPAPVAPAPVVPSQVAPSQVQAESALALPVDLQQLHAADANAMLAAQTSTSTSTKRNAKVDGAKRPDDWFYPGFFAMATFGPFSWCRHQQANFTKHVQDDPKSASAKKKSGRAAIRNEKNRS